MRVPIPALIRAVRPHQWTKNALVFLPALAGHVVTDVFVGARLLLGAIAFSLVASGVYLINDLRDASADRAHPIKRNRPVATGEVSRSVALWTTVLLTAFGLGTAAWLNRSFALIVLLYLTITLAYSLVLRRLIIVDVITLAGLYTTRIIAGSVLADVPLSRWFLAFSIFLFASLALVKRVGEIRSLGPGATSTGRGYHPDDFPVLAAMGASFAGASALVYSLYITGGDVVALYSRPDLLWFGLPLFLYWIARIWLLAGRGAFDEPVAFAVRDKASYVVLALFLLTIWVAA